MGQVWSAVHVVTGRRVAIKRLLLATEGNDEHRDNQARARFILEAQTACAVEHANVVQVLDFVEPGDEPPLLVMELLEGETLGAKLEREHALSLTDTLGILLPVVSAVGTAHSLGIVHRDLKPANIFLQQRGTGERTVKVLDFGIAKWVAQPPTGTGLRTQTGSTLGTPCYMAPEQAIGERVVDHTADIWSLGIILYECLAGSRPIDGENAVQMVVRLLDTGIMPIERAVPTLPDDVARLIGRMLARDPSRRPADLREIFEVLGKHHAVSAPPFAAPPAAVSDRKTAPAGARTSSDPVAATSPSDSALRASMTDVSGIASPASVVDATAATLRDGSTPPEAAPSWEGQSVSSLAVKRGSRTNKLWLTLAGVALIALVTYPLLHHQPVLEAVSTQAPPHDASASLENSETSARAALGSPPPTVSSGAAAPSIPTAQPTSDALLRHASGPSAVAKLVAPKGRITPQTQSKDDGTSDRK